MKKFKKTMIAMLCLCVMLGMTACGNNDNTDNDGKNNDVTEGTDNNDNDGVIDDIGNGVDDAGNAAGDVIDDVGDGVKDVTDDVTGNEDKK